MMNVVIAAIHIEVSGGLIDILESFFSRLGRYGLCFFFLDSRIMKSLILLPNGITGVDQSKVHTGILY